MRSMLLAVVVAVMGCGYSTGSLMPEGISTIAVRMGTNDTFYRGDEIALTGEVTRQLMRRTDVTVREIAKAEAVLSLRILDMGRVPLVVDERERTLEEGVISEVEVVLTERATGRVISKFKMLRRDEGIVQRGEDLNVVRAKVVRELAEDIVFELQKATFAKAPASRGS